MTPIHYYNPLNKICIICSQVFCCIENIINFSAYHKVMNLLRYINYNIFKHYNKKVKNKNT